MMDKSNNNARECSECKSTFIRQSDMIRHIKRFHPNKTEELIAGMENIIHPFKCNECDKGFTHKKNLNFHQKTHATDLNSGVKIRKKCPLCNHVATFKKDFYDHCREVHNILLDVEKMDFTTVDDFMNWKSEIEKAMNSKFVKEYGSTLKMTNYICNQSEYSVLENGVEKESTQNIKVNGFCPAGFRVMHEKSGKCSIYFIKTHICHQNKNILFENTEDIKSQTIKEEKSLKFNKDNKNKDLSPGQSKSSIENEEYISGEVITSSPKKNIEKKVMNLKKKQFITKKKEMIKQVVNTLNSISNNKELEAVQELLNPIKPILQILQSNTNSPKVKAKSPKKSK